MPHPEESPAADWLRAPHLVELTASGERSLSTAVVAVPPRQLVTERVGPASVRLWFDPVGHVDAGVVSGCLSFVWEREEAQDA